MTDSERAIIMACTGVCMLKGDKLNIFISILKSFLGYPVWTHELADRRLWDEIKEKSKSDFSLVCIKT